MTSFCDVTSWRDVMPWSHVTSWHHIVPIVHHAQRRSVVHNAGRWCTTQSCTVEVVHNVALTNPHTQTGLVLLSRLLTQEVKMTRVFIRKFIKNASFGMLTYSKCKFWNAYLWHNILIYIILLGLITKHPRGPLTDNVLPYVWPRILRKG